MSVTKPKLSLEKVLHLLRKPDARLVRLHSNNGGAGFYVWPRGGRVSDEVAQLLLGRNDIQPYGSGLFPGHPQSWRLGNWRDSGPNVGEGGRVSDEGPFGDLPRGRYAAIVADPPWSYACFSEKGKARSADRHYVTMAADAIEQLPVGELAACDAHLFLGSRARAWCGECISRLCARGASSPPQSHSSGSSPTRKAFANGGFFLDETLFAKGMGHTTRQNAEYVVLGRRGKPRRLRKDVHQLIIQPRREHSRKPDEFIRPR